MAKEFEKSIDELSPADTSAAASAASIGALVLLAAASVIAFLTGTWAIAVTVLLAFGSTASALLLSWKASRINQAASDRTKLEWRSAMPEIQRQDLNIEVIQLSKVLDVSSDQIADLHSAYIVAEDLALRQIQQEEGSLLLRHVTVGNVPFTGVLVKRNYIACLETSFVVSPELRQDRIDAIIRKIAAVKSAVQKQELKLDVRLMLVLITQLSHEHELQLRKIVKERFADTPVTSDIRFLDFETLQRIYVTD